MPPVWAAARRVLFLTVFIDLMGFGIVVPILAYVSKEYGANGMTLGLILGSFSFMQFLFSPVWGRLSDRIGRRPVLMISLFGNILGFSTFAFASNVAMLFATRILSGIASASISTAQAYIADTTDESSRSRETQARLRSQLADNSRALAERQFVQAFFTARTQAIAAQQRITQLRQSITDAEANVSASTARYRSGEATITEVIDAQNLLVTQRQALYQALFDYQLARSRVARAAGR